MTNILNEKQEIKTERIGYLRKIKLFRAENCPVVSIDEHYTHSYYVYIISLNKKDRFITVRACSTYMFIDGELFVFILRQKTGYFHDGMNGTSFN